MPTVQLITSKECNRYQHVKWILAYLKYTVQIVDSAGYQSNNSKIRNPSMIDPENGNIIQGENAIMTWAVLDATKNADNKNVPSEDRTLLGYCTADVLQIESLLEILTEIQRFAYDVIQYSNMEMRIPMGGSDSSMMHTPTITQKGNYYFNRYFKIRCLRKIESLKNFLGPKQFLVGYLTIADFKLTNVIDLFGKMSARFCLVNPFGNFHAKEYGHLGIKSNSDKQEWVQLSNFLGR